MNDSFYRFEVLCYIYWVQVFICFKLIQFYSSSVDLIKNFQQILSPKYFFCFCEMIVGGSIHISRAKLCFYGMVVSKLWKSFKLQFKSVYVKKKNSDKICEEKLWLFSNTWNGQTHWVQKALHIWLFDDFLVS